MTIARATAAALLCIGTAACGGGGGEEAENGGQAAEASQSGTGAGAPAAGAAAAPGVHNVPGPGQTLASGRLSPVNNSGVNGSANFKAVGEQTEISLNVTGATAANQQMQGSIVQGTCEQNGGEVAPVGPITLGTGNIATLTDTIPLPIATLLNGGTALLIKGQNAGPATPPLACSALPKWEPLPPVG
ncbi:hypothetical protein [Longimicrobium sp.]|uniref:hypothetical protein n=1 Tax=Longimicrobium sp. TaxID=2029185 RepID=UPI003B3AE940